MLHFGEALLAGREGASPCRPRNTGRSMRAEPATPDLAEIRSLIEHIDSAPNNNKNNMIVVPLKNAVANDLALIINHAVTDTYTETSGQVVGGAAGVVRQVPDVGGRRDDQRIKIECLERFANAAVPLRKRGCGRKRHKSPMRRSIRPATSTQVSGAASAVCLVKSPATISTEARICSST